MIKMTLTQGQVPVHIWTDDVDSSALYQLAHVADLLIIHQHVAAMPDVHAGIGATVASEKPSYRPLTDAVGVDIGRGMAAIRTLLTVEPLPDSSTGLRQAIEAGVPVGFNKHGARTARN